MIKNNTMLLRIAQADAYASAIEYVSKKDHEDLYSKMKEYTSYQQHPTYSLKPGQFTDDTQMSFAVTTTLMFSRRKDKKPSKKDFLTSFFITFKIDPIDGYSRGFQKILEESKTVSELSSKLKGDSTSNGAAMRSVPLGVLNDVKDVIEYANIQASTTHNTEFGKASSVAIALMSHYSLHVSQEYSKMYDWCCYINQNLNISVGHGKAEWVSKIQIDKI